MDYDRALYRVYERIMEELNASPSPLAMTSSNHHHHHHHHGRTGNHDQRHHYDLTGRDRQELEANGIVAAAAVEGGGDAPAVDDDHNNSTTNINIDIGSTNNHDVVGDGDGSVSVRIPPNNRRLSSTLATRRFSYSSVAIQQRQRQRQHQPLPFFFPIWTARKIDQMMEQNRLRHHDNILLHNLWSKIRRWMNLTTNLGGIRHDTYTSVMTSLTPRQNSSHSTTPNSVSSSMSFHDYHHDHHDNNGDDPIPNTDLQLVTEDDDVEAGQISSISRLQQQQHPSSLDNQSPSSRTSSSSSSSTTNISDGLRRRSNSRQGGTGTTAAAYVGLGQQRQHENSASPSASVHRRGGNIVFGEGDNTIPPSMPNDLSLSQRVESSEVTHNRGQYQSGRSSSSSNIGDSSSVGEGYSSNEESNTSSSSSSSSSGVSTSSSSDDSNTIRNNDDGDDYDDHDASDRRIHGTNDHNNYDRGGCSQLNVYIAMRLSFAVAVLHIFVLVSLHCTYVGPYAFHGWQKQQQKHQYNCISYALSTRPIEDRSSYFERKEKNVPSNGNDIAERRLTYEPAVEQEGSNLQDNLDQTIEYHQDVAGNESDTSVSEAFHPLLGKDEILQIKILYGKSCVGQCSKVRNVVYPVQLDTESSDNITDEGIRGEQSRTLSRVETNDEEQSSPDYNIHSGRRVLLHLSNTSYIEDNMISEDELSSPTYWEKVHYRFGLDDALIHLDEMSAFLHNITLVNVTVTERCLSSGSDDGDLSILNSIGEFLSQIYGLDSIIINQLMYGIRGADGAFTSGYLKSMETQERWGWHSELLDAFENKSIKHVVAKKLGVLSMSILAFFLVTSVTSLIVRVLTSSGVVLMFPMFTLLRLLGLPGADERLISLSYPWIGAARAAIAAEHSHPQAHLVCAHVTKVLLYYVMYEACQAAWSVVLYAKSIPEALPVWIFGFAMIIEYFSMVFVRSALSVHFFPRVTLLYFVCYHAYFYSVPYGFFGVALIPLFFFIIHAMLYTIIGLEVPKSARGVLSVACPREVFNRLSWQAPSAAIPQEWTIFLPLNSRLNPLHDREIPSDEATSANRNDVY